MNGKLVQVSGYVFKLATCQHRVEEEVGQGGAGAFGLSQLGDRLGSNHGMNTLGDDLASMGECWVDVEGRGRDGCRPGKSL